jgi:hypothetical protein
MPIHHQTSTDEMGFKGAQISSQYLEGTENDMRVGADPNCSCSLLDGLESVLDLEEAALGRPSSHIIVIEIAKLARHRLMMIINRSDAYHCNTAAE